MPAMAMAYGALAHGRRVDTDVASTVEARRTDAGQLVALIAVQGDIATPSLESVKSALARVDLSSLDVAAAKLAGSGPPPPYCKGASVVLLFDNFAYVAATGGARCYRERGGALAELPAGAHAIEPGEAFVAASHASLHVGRAFFTTATQPTAGAELRIDALDADLESALAQTPALIAVAAARMQ